MILGVIPLMECPHHRCGLLQQVCVLCDQASSALQLGENEKALVDIMEAIKVTDAAPGNSVCNSIYTRLNILKVKSYVF